MVIFTRELEGVILEDCDETIKVEMNLVTGRERRNKSGKPWNLDKGVRGGGQLNIGVEDLKRRRKEKDELKELNKSMSKSKKDHFKKA
jgi:hypothetical protein